MNKENYRIAEAERKRLARERMKLLMPDVYKLKKEEEKHRSKMYRVREKLDLIDPKPT